MNPKANELKEFNVKFFLKRRIFFFFYMAWWSSLGLGDLEQVPVAGYEHDEHHTHHEYEYA